MTKGYFEFEYLKRRDLKDEVQKVVQNYFNIYNSVAGTVDYFANLPSASANLNKIWLVRFATTFLGIITKQAGLYISDGTNWNWMTNLEAKADKNILISAGNGLTGGGDLSANRTISHSDTSSQVNVVNTGGNVIQSANLDDFGHITSFSSIDLDNRYITTSGAYANPTWITSLNASKLTGTIPSNVLSGSTLYIGTTAIALNRASGNQALTGISSVQFTGATSGTATLQAPAIAGTTTFTLPATSGNLIGSGDVGSVSNTMLAGSIADSKLNTITTAGKVANSATTATNLNTASSIVARDASGNFSAGTITASLSGNSTTATTLQTARTINGVSFNGSADITITANTSNALTISSPLTGSSFNGNSAVSIGIQTATSLLSGALSSTDWNTFNNKQNAISLTTTGNSGASTFVSNTLNIPNYTLAGLGGQPLLSGTGFIKANGTTITYDNSTYITQNQIITLSGDVTGSGRTAITTTLANSGVVAGTYQSATTITPLTIDAKGRVTSVGAATAIAPAFSSITGKPTTIAGYGITNGVTLDGTETLTNKTFTDSTTFFQDNLDNTKKAQFELSNIATATTRTYTLPNVNGTIITTGDTATVTNTMLAGSIADTKLNTITTAGKVANSSTSATNLNTANAIVSRDASGNFDAGTITGALSGNSTTATTLQTARTINGVSFDGSADITVTDNTKLPLSGGGIVNGDIQITGTGRLLYLNGTTTSRLDFGNNGAGAPTFTTRSNGLKIMLWNSLNSANVDYGIGVQASSVWYSAPSVSSGQHLFYVGTTLAVRIKNEGLRINGELYQGNSAFTALNITSTLTIAQILTLVIESTPTANITFTLPTGTDVDAGVITSLETFASFTWSIVNIATGFTITMAGNTGNTYIGNTTIAANTSATFRTQKTATNTFKTVRI